MTDLRLAQICVNQPNPPDPRSIPGSIPMVSVAIIDSGVNPNHPHLNGVAGGVGISPDGKVLSTDYLDYIGHGTAVAGAIHEKAPDAALCQSLVEIVDDQGNCLEEYDHTAFGTDSQRASVRFAARLRPHDCQEVFGVMRSDVLRRTELIGYHIGGDRTLLG